jgi:hypothetical protein
MSFVDKYLNRTFSYKTYNCFHFVRDVWLELTGVDIGDQVPDDKSMDSYNTQALKVANTLVSLANPEDPCLVLLQRARIEPHIGVYYRGRVLHLSRQGAYYAGLDQVSAGYTKVSFYK